MDQYQDQQFQSVKTSNQYANVSQISVSGSPTTAAGNIRIGTNTSTNNVATTSAKSGGNLTLEGSASSISTNDSVLTIGS